VSQHIERRFRHIGVRMAVGFCEAVEFSLHRGDVHDMFLPGVIALHHAR